MYSKKDLTIVVPFSVKGRQASCASSFFTNPAPYPPLSPPPPGEVRKGATVG